MKKIFTLSVFLFLSSFVFAADVTPQKSVQGKTAETKYVSTYSGFEHKFRQLKGQLELDAVQNDAVDKLDKETSAKRKETRKKIDKLNADKASALAGKKFDQARKNAADISALDAEIEKDRIDYIEKISKILNPQQNKKLDELLVKTETEKRERAKALSSGNTQNKNAQKDVKKQNGYKKTGK